MSRDNLHHPLVVPAQWYRAAQLLGDLPPVQRTAVIRQAQQHAWAAGWSDAAPETDVLILGDPPAAEEPERDMDTELIMATLISTRRREDSSVTPQGRWFREIG